jgi:D-3-phosphoglycerate dehydrogenase
MQVGRKSPGGEAVVLIQIDSKPSEEVMQEIKNSLNEINANLKEINYLKI